MFKRPIRQILLHPAKYFATLFLVTAALFPSKSKAQITATFERLDPEINSVFGANPSIEVIAKGEYSWVEGPLWVESHKMLLFSDVPNNKVMKWTAGNGVEVYLEPSGYTGTIKRGGEMGSNGLILNNKGQLILCQDGDRQIGLMDAPLNKPKPVYKALATNYNGKKFDSPNDAAFNKKGDLYFTDPPYGLEKNVRDPLKEAPYQGVYRLSADGKVTMLTDTLTRPNGIAFFPGEKKMIIANSDARKAYWYIYDVNSNGLLENGRIFYSGVEAAKTSRGLPDGLKVDKKGYVFASGPGGFWIFNSTGKLLGKIRFNGLVSNCTLADNDKTMYVTADKNIVKVNLR